MTTTAEAIALLMLVASVGFCIGFVIGALFGGRERGPRP